MTSVYLVASGKMAGKYCAQLSITDPITGKRSYIRGFATTKEEAIARMVERKVRRQVPKPSGKPRDRKPKRTLRDLIKRWQELNKNKFSSEHIFRTERRIANHLGHLLDEPVAALTKPRMETEFATLLDTTKASPSAYLNTRKACVALFNFAVKQDWISATPMRDIEKPYFVSKVEKDDEELIEERAQLYQDFLGWLDFNGSDDYYWVLFMSLGLRRGELCGLELDSVSDAADRITIDRQFRIGSGGKPAGIYEGTKNKRGRRVMLPELHRLDLPGWLRKRAEIEPLEPWAKNQLFPYQRKDGTWHGRTTNRLWTDFNTLLDEYGKTIVEDGKWQYGKRQIEWEKLKFRPHYMRHITASYLARTQTPIDITKSVLGHMSTRMTELYTHIMMKDQQAAVQNAMAHLAV